MVRRWSGCRAFQASSSSSAATAGCGWTSVANVDPELVLAAAEQSAHVVAFSYGPPTLAELFLELVAP